MTKLYIVPTPIGNLEDITQRALKVLQESDLILAEDTRKTGLLLKHFQITKKLFSHHQVNEHKTINTLVERIKCGETMALVSDAGTPGISDPGYLLIRACLAEDIKVECLPGPTAFIPALVVSGLPTDRFIFEGFLPHKKGRKSKLEELATAKHTLVFYESPHRLIKTLRQFQEYFGADRKISVSREITKIFEETIRGPIKEVLYHFENHPIKGEFVLVVEGKTS